MGERRGVLDSLVEGLGPLVSTLLQVTLGLGGGAAAGTMSLGQVEEQLRTRGRDLLRDVHLASAFHAHATTSTIRAHLINVPARLARGARRLTLHLPQGWPWQAAWNGLHAAVHRPAATTP